MLNNFCLQILLNIQLIFRILSNFSEIIKKSFIENTINIIVVSDQSGIWGIVNI